jgi:serine/threonine protein kinase
MFVLPTEHYQGINFPSDFNLKKFLEIRQFVDCDVIERMQLVRRIGSESLHAKVYAGELNRSIIAVKVLKRVEKFANEMIINEILLEDPTNDLYFLYLIRGLIYDNEAFLIMEMAMSDVQQRVKYSIELPQDIYRTVSEVLQSLLRLARLGIFHADLHLGNVFLVMRNGQLRTVIGDFGESSVAESPTASSSDLFQFINALRQKLYHNHEVISVLDTFFSRIGKVAGKCETNFDNYIELKSTEKDTVIRCNVEFIESAISEWRYIFWRQLVMSSHHLVQFYLQF